MTLGKRASGANVRAPAASRSQRGDLQFRTSTSPRSSSSFAREGASCPSPPAASPPIRTCASNARPPPSGRSAAGRHRAQFHRPRRRQAVRGRRADRAGPACGRRCRAATTPAAPRRSSPGRRDRFRLAQRACPARTPGPSRTGAGPPTPGARCAPPPPAAPAAACRAGRALSSLSGFLSGTPPAPASWRTSETLRASVNPMPTSRRRRAHQEIVGRVHRRSGREPRLHPAGDPVQAVHARDFFDQVDLAAQIGPVRRDTPVGCLVRRRHRRRFSPGRSRSEFSRPARRRCPRRAPAGSAPAAAADSAVPGPSSRSARWVCVDAARRRRRRFAARRSSARREAASTPPGPRRARSGSSRRCSARVRARCAGCPPGVKYALSSTMSWCAPSRRFPRRP